MPRAFRTENLRVFCRTNALKGWENIKNTFFLCLMRENKEKQCLFAVAPRAGAWIEIQDDWKPDENRAVAPRAGAWIEIRVVKFMVHGLTVAPRAGAWIEIE